MSYCIEWRQHATQYITFYRVALCCIILHHFCCTFSPSCQNFNNLQQIMESKFDRIKTFRPRLHWSQMERFQMGSIKNLYKCIYTRPVGTVPFGNAIRTLLAPLKERFQFGALRLVPMQAGRTEWSGAKKERI